METSRKTLTKATTTDKPSPTISTMKSGLQGSRQKELQPPSVSPNFSSLSQSSSLTPLHVTLVHSNFLDSIANHEALCSLARPVECPFRLMSLESGLHNPPFKWSSRYGTAPVMKVLLVCFSLSDSLNKETIYLLEKSFFYDNTLDFTGKKANAAELLYGHIWRITSKFCCSVAADTRVHEFFKTSYFKTGIHPIPGLYRSRQNAIRDHTIEWIEKHYKGLFQEIHFGNHFALEGQSRPKSDICRSLGAKVLIDDNPRYAMECAEVGIRVLLFDYENSYPWCKIESVNQHPLVTKVNSWEEVEHQLVSWIVS
ncbi:hypothetical protein TEA_007195 [Camellia sinensis var. sinensis]|uniref:Uncharacterized protein n=1 Tax=Camellia sinensis var. sinensis TaxID=542762 RepID=A0A4S4ERM6_CAMSN|nr:hypothetical protein TEA_007195 [Camellia sinensis var. sinensis]